MLKRYIISFTNENQNSELSNNWKNNNCSNICIYVLFTWILWGCNSFRFIHNKLGELLDPIADKIIVATALILLVMDGTIRNYEVIAAIIILTREILISGLREFLAKGRVKLPVSSLAKVKTFLQMFSISILLTGETGNKIINFQDYNAQTIGIILLWLSAFLTLYTGYEYLRKGIDHAISEDNKN